MKKALEILKNLQIDVKKDIEAEGVEVFGYIDTAIEEAIAELEALENRSCDDCKNNLGGYCELYESEFINIINRDIDFCCNKWESR